VLQMSQTGAETNVAAAYIPGKHIQLQLDVLYSHHGGLLVAVLVSAQSTTGVPESVILYRYYCYCRHTAVLLGALLAAAAVASQ
jgi:hypothetical protein